jgi:hypothetical protein
VKKPNLQILVSSLSLFTILSCSNEEKKIVVNKIKDSVHKIQPKEKIKKVQLPLDSFYNNNAQLIGGKVNISKISGILDTIFIKEYCQRVDEKYAKIEDNRLRKMGNWNYENMKRNNQIDTSFAFYPFSGGDFIHLNWLYPNASRYLMLAQEDVGNIPDLNSKHVEFVNQYLNDVEIVLRDIYSKSYFITKNMIDDTRQNTLVNGMLPLILWAVSRTNHEITGLQFANLNDKGQLEFLKDRNPKEKPEAVQISFRKIGSEQIKTVTYVSCNISDAGFNEKPKLYSFINNAVNDKCNSFVKSASYLLHYNTFEKIRSFIKSKSKYLVQDDTGIPFRQFIKDGNWKIELFGKYEEPVKDFSSNLYQKDLDSAYKNITYFKGLIDFSLGYHWGSKNQNQMVFIKNN